MDNPRTKHQGNKYIANKGKGLPKKLADGFTEWRYKDTGEAIPEGLLSTTPNGDKIKISYARKVKRLEHPAPHDFVYFEVKRFSTSGTEFIGRITEYTTEDRLTSLIFRYLHPEHARPCTFEGMVLFSGGAEGSGVSRMPYVEIPDKIIDEAGLMVDDEVQFTLTSMGDTYTGHYHLSNMGLYRGLDGPKTRLILPLTQVKRLVIVETEIIGGNGHPLTRFRFVPKSVYDQHTLMLKLGEPLTYPHTYTPRKTKDNPNPRPITKNLPCRRFINDYVGLTVELVPEERTANDWPGARSGRFDFTIETIWHGRARSSPGGGSND